MKSDELHMHLFSPRTKRILIAVVGSIVLLAGVAMLVLPGPAFIVIPAGLAILATEFEWAHRWLGHVRAFIRRKKGQLQQRRKMKTDRS